MKSEKVKSYLYKMILSILFILVAYVTYCSIFNIYNPSIEMKPIIIIFGIVTCIFVFIALKKIINKIDEKKSNIIAIILCILFFIGASILGSKMVAIPTYDLSDIQKEVQIMLENGGKFVDQENYFAIYKAQQPVAILIYYIYKIGRVLGAGNLRIFATIVDSLFISIAAFFTYLSVKKLKDHKLALITLIFFVINPIFYLYNSWFYTDTFCMPFAASAIYLFILATKTEKSKKAIIYFIFSGLLLSIGFKLRVVVGILLIAMIMGVFLNNRLNKKMIRNIVCLIIGFIAGIFLYTLIAIPFDTETDKNYEIPPTHWVMMALKTDAHGAWNKEDYDATIDKETYSDKVSFNIEVIKQRLQELRIKGLIEFSKIKLARNWSNGDYDYISKLDNVENINNIYEYISGNRRAFLVYYCQIMKATMMFILLITIVKEIYKRDKEENYNVIYIAIFGAFLFYLMWEVCGRYSLSFLPWMILVFGIGINQIEEILNINIIQYKAQSGKYIRINMQKIQKVAIISIILVTIILLIINYFELTIDKDAFWNKRVVVQTTNNLESKNIKISNKKIEQTFKTSMKFNSIAIRLKNEGTKSITYYTFSLYNAYGEEIYTEDFKSNSVKDNKYKTFNFKEVKPEGNEEYIIQIFSKDATDDDSIGVWAMCKEDFSIYPEGKVKINGESSDIDLMFRVQNKSKRPYTSKKVYIAISVVILALELFGFYPYLKRNNKKLLEENYK